MGLTDSPYRSLQLLMKAKFTAYGDRLNKKNTFQWEMGKLNLPGSDSYDPQFPWVMKVRMDGELACEVYIYVEDGPISGHSEITCWEAAMRLCSVCVSLGIQDASRKRTGPSLYPEPWAGTVLHTGMGVVTTVTLESGRKQRN